MVEITAVSYPYQAMSDPTAVVGRRVLATIVDGLVIVGPAIAVTAAQLDLQYLDSDEVGVSLSTFCDTLESQSDNYVCFQAGDRVYFSEQSPVAGTPVALVIALLMAVVLQGLTGWTLGKLITGIRTVREDGQAPGLGRALLRWVLLVVDTFRMGVTTDVLNRLFSNDVTPVRMLRDLGAPAIDEALMRENTFDRVRELLQLLNPIEKDIIRRRFGLGDDSDQSDGHRTGQLPPVWANTNRGRAE